MSNIEQLDKYLVVTSHGDGFLCWHKPEFEGSEVSLRGWHFTRSGWWGVEQEVVLSAYVIRYVERTKTEPYGPLPTPFPPGL